MYYAIKGQTIVKGSNFVVLDNNGIEYKIFCSGNSLKEITKEFQFVKMFTLVHHTEKEISLFGFKTTTERDLFSKLIKVTSIGNKVALLVLSSFTPESFTRIVKTENVRELMKVKGIGEKVAVKIILKVKL